MNAFTQIRMNLGALCLLCAGTALAQESPLGSPAAAATRYSTDYAAVVRAALPAVDAAELARLMEAVRDARAGSLALRSPQEIAKTLQLRSRDEKEANREVDAGEAIYRFDPESAHLRAVWRAGSAKPVPRDAFKAMLPEIRRSQEALAARLGIERRDALFVDFREVLSQTDGDPATQRGARGRIIAEGATSTFLRAVAGVLVEGSYGRFTSIDARQMSSIDIRWPAVKLADEVRPAGLRAPREVADDIVRRIESTSNRLPVSVRMAVVLRPVDPKKPGLYVPSLKIGVKPQSVKTADGYSTDAGEVFFSDLLKSSPPIVLPEEKDKETSAEG